MTSNIELQNIIHSKGGSQVLSIPRFKISKGSKLALVGPNGAGKSSLLEIIALIDKPDKGNIFIEGYEINRANILNFRRKIGFLPQKPEILKLSVQQNIALPLKFRKVPADKIKAAVDYWMDKLHITHLSQKTGANLSGGEQQKIALARMMAADPEILLFDEPLTGIDSESKITFVDELSAIISRSDRTIIFVSHNIKEANAISDGFEIIDIRNLQGPVIH